MMLQISGTGKIKKIGKLHLKGDRCYLPVTIAYIIELPNKTAKITLILNQQIKLQQKLSRLNLNDVIIFKSILGCKDTKLLISCQQFRVLNPSVKNKSNKLKKLSNPDVIDSELLKRSLFAIINKLQSTS